MASKNSKERDNSISFTKCGGREELVGKRFLLVQGGPKPKITRVQDWAWKAGVVRCASHADYKDPELQVQSILFTKTNSFIICSKKDCSVSSLCHSIPLKI